MDKNAAFERIAAEVAKGELAFPTSAQVALKVRQALDDPECHIEAAAKLVQAEPVLAARVVAMANSAAFNRSGREITDVKTSVARLGFRTVRSLATALVTRQLAGKPAGPDNQKLAAQLWEHTTHVAALARVLARQVTKQDPDTAMFAGIVHEVGGFYLLSRAAEFPGLLDGDMAAWIEQGQAVVGRAVLAVLNVPEAVRDALEGFYAGFLAMPPASMTDTLLLAEELAPVPSPLLRPGEEANPQRPAGEIEMQIGEDLLSAILSEAADEVASLSAALKF